LEESEEDGEVTETPLTGIRRCIKVRGGEGREEIDPVAVEEPYSVILNGRHAMDVVMSPKDLRDFLVGHLICDGTIEDPKEVSSFKEGSGWLEAEYTERGRRPEIWAREIIFSSCFGSSPKGVVKRIERIDSDLRVRWRDLLLSMRKALRGEGYRLTGGMHGAAVFQADAESHGVSLAALRHDIGRHTALDKAIGAAALKGCDLTRCLVVTTGRASSEMVAKCHAAGVPILVSRGATTTLACWLADLAGITLIGFIRGERMNIYSNEERVVLG